MSKTISFGLIRSKNPHVDSADDIGQIDSITLSGCELTDIDNLELFSHINELDLSNNKISKVENLFFFQNLKILDLSFNLIDSLSLEQSIKEFPKSLLSINLTGNPCANDEAALGKLQDAIPDLAIAIEIDDTVRVPDKQEEEDDDDDDNIETDEELEDIKQLLPLIAELGNTPLNADEVLKSIVERKCKLQDLQCDFDLKKVVTELNSETDHMLEETTKRKQLSTRFAGSIYSSDKFDERFAGLQQRREQSANDVQQLVARMKATVEAKLHK